MSDVNALIEELRQLGVSLWHDGSRVRYRAPSGVLSTHLLDRLKANKDALAAFLVAAQHGALTGAATREPITPHLSPSAALSFAQERLWFLHKFGGREGGLGSTYNVAAAVRLRGALDGEAVRRAVAEIIRRHSILRSVFIEEQSGVVQRVERDGAALRCVDLSAVPSSERESATGEFIAREAAHVFKLEGQVLVRFSLVRLAQTTHCFVCVLHHLVTDGWSMGVLFREFAALYQAFAQARPSPLADLPVQYADFAVHQRHTMTRERLAHDLKFWQEHLAGAPASIELPLDHPRPADQSYRGAVHHFEFGAELTVALKRLAVATNSSLFMVLLAGYAKLLSSYCGQSDIVIGTPVANRDRDEVEPLIGLFSNYIPLRINVAGELTVLELIARVRRLTLQCYEHQHVPFEKLVEAVKPQRERGLSPLFQVALVLQNLPDAPQAVAGLEIERITIERDTAKLDLSILLEEIDGALHVEIEYCDQLFNVSTARRFARHLTRTYEAMVESPDRRIDELTLHDPAEQAAIVRRLSRCDVRHPRHELIHEWFTAQAAICPSTVAVVDGLQSLTYAELARRASQLARHLAALGVKPDTAVGVCLPRSVDLIIAVLAVLEAGAAYVPLDSAHPPQRLARMLDGVGARLVVTNTQILPRLPQLPHAVCLDRDAERIQSYEDAPLQIAMATAQLAYVIYTSGSSGEPKGVMVPHTAVCHLVAALGVAVYDVYDGPVNVALVAPVVFDASVQQIFGSLLNGHTLYIVDEQARTSGARLLEFLDRHEITVVDATPSMFRLLLEAGLGTGEHSRIAHLLIGGEALPSQLIEQLHAQDHQHRITVTNLYGLTECGVDSTFKSVGPREAVASAFVPIGRPLPNTRLYIVDDAGQPAPVGVPGEIWIGGPSLARGYVGNASLSAMAFRPDRFEAGSRLYASGDRGRWTDAGEIEFLGRADGQVKVRGYRIELGEVEVALQSHSGVAAAAVAVARADLAHAQLYAYVVAVDTPPTVADLRSHLVERLPSYMIPSAFMILPSLPLNSSGKVDRARLPTMPLRRQLEQGVDFQAPSNAREKLVAKLWAEVLDGERIGLNDNFFALGGDSIKALQVVSKGAKYGWRVELRDIFTQSSLAALAARIEPLRERLDHATPVFGGEIPLGPVQTAFLVDYPGPKEHFHQALLLAPDEAMLAEPLEQAVAAVIRHHDALRLRYKQVDEQWVQELVALGEVAATEVVNLADVGDPQAQMHDHASARMARTDLAHGPLFCATLYRMAAGDRLLLAAHHLVVDGVSWRILVEDLHSAYVQALAGTDIALAPVTDAYGNWAMAMRSAAQAMDDAQRAYWERAQADAGATLPLDHPHAVAMRQDRAEHRLTLREDLTQDLLTKAHDAYATRMPDLLIAALGRALVEWGKARRWQVLVESHGRDVSWQGADLSRTVGWFTARYPVTVDFSVCEDVGRQIKAAKELMRGVPQGGAGYEAGKYLAGTVARRHGALPAIAFNYLGQLGSDLRTANWRWVDEDAGHVVAADAPLVHDLEIIGFVMNARMHLAIGYARTRFEAATIAALGDSLQMALADIVRHTCTKQESELTPSDIDYDGFDIDALDSFVRNL